jgi:hypothetical protein
MDFFSWISFHGFLSMPTVADVFADLPYNPYRVVVDKLEMRQVMNRCPSRIGQC